MFASFVRRVLEVLTIDAYGRRHEIRGRDGPEVTIRLHDRALHHRLDNPHLHLGEALHGGQGDHRAGHAVRLSRHLYHQPGHLPRQELARAHDQAARSAFAPSASVQPLEAGARPTSLTTTTCRTPSTSCFWTGTGSILAATSPIHTTTSTRRSATRSATSLPRCCSDLVKECSTSARGGAASRCSSPTRGL